MQVLLPHGLGAHAPSGLAACVDNEANGCAGRHHSVGPQRVVHIERLHVRLRVDVALVLGERPDKRVDVLDGPVCVWDRRGVAWVSLGTKVLDRGRRMGESLDQSSAGSKN